MKISYKWLSEYLPVTVEPDRLSRILTSIGLEVEDLFLYEEVRGGLKGLVVGEVLTCEKHPNADKLSLTTVDIAENDTLQIVCGAPNVAVGQKVIVARPGTTIYPITGEPVTLKLARIRGVESEGMICAEDEIGLGTSHAGIMILPKDTKTGITAAEYFHPYQDWVFEIGLTPNRMDAMSHWGVARDVCAYLSHHEKKGFKPRIAETNDIKTDNHSLPIEVIIENKQACQRYSGVSISGIRIAPSPLAIQQRLKAVGVRPINNIVDITNYIQHETGQPLHAYDSDELKSRKIVVKNLPAGTEFITLDEKKRKLFAEDLMICDGNEGICIAGVFGGIHSGVTDKTQDIFLEAAWFNPVDIRKTSFRHNLRTDAASRFEKGTDIGNTVNVLKRAAKMIREICGGEIASEIVDVYPVPKQKTQITLKYHYLKKLSGKNYHPDTIRVILTSLGFDLIKEGMDELILSVPFHKPDISLPADVVEEIIRIDGLDNIEIPLSITMTPSIDENYSKEVFREKTANYLVGLGFNEILTNSITNEAYFDELELQGSVKMLNSLSADLNMMRPSMLETGLGAVAFNLNRKNNDLRFFDFGKTYRSSLPGSYIETEHLCLYVTGNVQEDGWRNKGTKADLFYLKGVVNSLLELRGIPTDDFQGFTHQKLSPALQLVSEGQVMIQFGMVQPHTLKRFDIRQPVFYADFDWQSLGSKVSGMQVKIEEIPRFPAVFRDLAILVPAAVKYEQARQVVEKLRLDDLKTVKLFDLFESDKIGAGRKSMAISFMFLNKEKTLTDKEIDASMGRIMAALEKDLNADIRK